ncbi:hypothetical protein BS47DRAFT_1401344 [Hydnum rufescens UP504]|uniref:Uncharacterized protein n=1 Tax=Hydnum rufescens UP504 TaxID=1448309 RepID=A0A9P6AEN8_9AGAM|nr:hypothetical protein BS47DRAFT_1401344 [Hydnum rufescens UP504]
MTQECTTYGGIPGSSLETTQEWTTYGGIPGSSRETTQENQIAGWENAQTNKDRDMKARDEHEATTRHIMSSTWRTGGMKASKAKERDDVSEGWKFGMWNQRGVETTHATNLAERVRLQRVVDRDTGIQIGLRWEWFENTLETMLEGKRIQDIPILELTSEGKKALARGEFRPFGGNHRRSAIEILVKTAKAELDRAMDAAQRVHDDLEEMTTEADKSEGKAQLEELTKTIGWLKGEMKWNHLWHLNVWDLDQLRLTSYPEDIIFAHLSRNTNKYVYLETESERVLLDIQEVRSALKRDDDIWASQIASTGDIKDLELSMQQTNFARELKVYGKRQTQVKGRQNSTTNSFIYSWYAVRMMCRYAHCGSHYFNGHYQSLKGMRVLLEGHLSGIFSTLFDINHRILMVAGSPHPFGTAADKKEVSTPSEHKRGHHSPSWKRTYLSMCQNIGDPSWLGQMMGMFDVAFKNAFCGDQGVMKDFLTKSKQYLEAFREYMSEVQEIIRRQITTQGLGVEYQNACVHLEWLLRHWPYGNEIPVPLLSNTMLEWMEERMKPVSDGIVKVVPRDDPGNMSNPCVFPGHLPGRPGKCVESSCFPGSSQETTQGNMSNHLVFLGRPPRRPGKYIGVWFDPLAWYNSEHSHAKTKVRDMSSTLFDTILQDPLITKRIHDATEAVATYLLFNSFSALVDLTRSVCSLHECSGARPPASIIKSIPTPGLRSRGKAKAKAVDAEESYPFFGSLDPPVHEEVIDRAWSSLKASWDDSKTALHSSDDTEKSFPQMALLVERHFLLIAIHTDESSFPFWDLLLPSPLDSSSLLSPAEIDRLSALESDLSEGRKFNQKILSLVERSKFTHLNFDPKTNLSGGIKIALDSLLWELELHQERQRRALYPTPRQKSSQRPILHKQDVSRASYSHFSAISAPLPPPPTRSTSSPHLNLIPLLPPLALVTQSDDDDKGATTTDAPSEGFDLDHPDGDNDDDATNEEVPHPPLQPPQSQSDQDDDEDDPNLRTPIPPQCSSQPRSSVASIPPPFPFSRSLPHFPTHPRPRLATSSPLPGPTAAPSAPPACVTRSSARETATSSSSLAPGTRRNTVPFPGSSPETTWEIRIILPYFLGRLHRRPGNHRHYSPVSWVVSGDDPGSLLVFLFSRVISWDNQGKRDTYYMTPSIVIVPYTYPPSPPFSSLSLFITHLLSFLSLPDTNRMLSLSPSLLSPYSLLGSLSKHSSSESVKRATSPQDDRTSPPPLSHSSLTPPPASSKKFKSAKQSGPSNPSLLFSFSPPHSPSGRTLHKSPHPGL